MSSAPVMLTTGGYPTPPGLSPSAFPNHHQQQLISPTPSPYQSYGSKPASDPSSSSYASSQYLFNEHAPSLPPFSQANFQDVSSPPPAHQASTDTGIQECRPFSLPSLATLTASLTSSSPSLSESSHVGPRRTPHQALASLGSGRRFSPLGSHLDCQELISPLESDPPMLSTAGRQPSGSASSLMNHNGNRPRSRSMLSGNSSTLMTCSELANDESGSESGASERKRGYEEKESSDLTKKRSRTLTTPSQQRRLMQILEQRRQGMKKALEQKAEQEASVASAAEYNRARGYSFGAYPAPPSDLYVHASQLAQPTHMGIHVNPTTGTPQTAQSAGLDSFGNQTQLYAPRSLTRNGISRHPPQLQLVTHSTSHPANLIINESSGTPAEFSWSQSSASSTSYSNSSAAECEIATGPLGRPKPARYTGSTSTSYTFPPSGTLTRNRSQTNPGFFGMVSNLSGPSRLGQISRETNKTEYGFGCTGPVPNHSNIGHSAAPPKTETWLMNYPGTWSDLNSANHKQCDLSEAIQNHMESTHNPQLNQYPSTFVQSHVMVGGDSYCPILPKGLETLGVPIEDPRNASLDVQEYNDGSHNRQRSHSFNG